MNRAGFPATIALSGTSLVTTELEGGALPKFFGMEVMSMVYFSFQDLMSFGIFIVALLTFIFQNRK